MDKEKQVIDFDPTEQTRESLPGADRDAVDTEVQAFREDLQQRASSNPSTGVETETDGGSEVDRPR